LPNCKLQQTYTGDVFTVIHCEDALQSYLEALKGVEARKREKFTRAMEQQIMRLANGHRMSKENFPQEGNLPSKPGQTRNKKFNALKRIPIRGYCWLSDSHPATYFISHYVHKKKAKLDPKDTQRVGDNWRALEVNDP